MQHGETTLRSHKIHFVSSKRFSLRSRRPPRLQFRELSKLKDKTEIAMSKKENTSQATVPRFVLVLAPNIEGAKDSAKYHQEKTAATKSEIEKTLKVSPHKRRPENVLNFFANNCVLQI